MPQFYSGSLAHQRQFDVIRDLRKVSLIFERGRYPMVTDVLVPVHNTYTRVRFPSIDADGVPTESVSVSPIALSSLRHFQLILEASPDATNVACTVQRFSDIWLREDDDCSSVHS